MNKVEIMPSLLSANFHDIKTDMEILKSAGIKEIHYDVMDGHFVPNISFGPKILREIKKGSPEFYYDTHLMISNPEQFIMDYIEAGSDAITWHIEIETNHDSLIKICKDNNIKSGLSIKPKTDVSKIEKYLNKIDIVLVMSVEPGFGGQLFIESSLYKIKKLSDLKKQNNYNYEIIIDGGINIKTSKLCREAGANKLVAGSYLFNSKNIKKAVELLNE